MQKLKKRRNLFQLLFWFWLLFILTNSLFPKQVDTGGSSTEFLFLRMDYLVHFGAYFLLAQFFFFWQSNGYLVLFKRQFLLFLTGAVLLAVGSEFLQMFIPGRSFNEYDLLSNSIGLAAGIILPQIYYRKIKTRDA